jgi:hypothetical protein
MMLARFKVGKRKRKKTHFSSSSFDSFGANQRGEKHTHTHTDTHPHPATVNFFLAGF